VRAVAADGHCLFRAVADQLRLAGDEGAGRVAAAVATAQAAVPRLVRQAAARGVPWGGEAAETAVLAPHAALRVLAADVMRRARDEFAPFVVVDGDAPAGAAGDPEAAFERYCLRMADSARAEWGGQPELLALSRALDCAIEVVQVADIPPTGSSGRATLAAPLVLGARDARGPPLCVAYHRHYYALGEHYNSVGPVGAPPVEAGFGWVDA
jgi:OTU domain-containing protein 6